MDGVSMVSGLPHMTKGHPAESMTSGNAKRALADITNEPSSSPRKILATEKVRAASKSSIKEPLWALDSTEDESACSAERNSSSETEGEADWPRLLDLALQKLQLSERVVAIGGCLHLQEDEGIVSSLDDEADPQQVAEYAGDIFDKLGRDEEDFCLLRPEYMKDQPELCAEERSIAVDWLVEVQVKYKLRTETLFLAVSLIDRFLSMRKVKRDDLQLIVVCASFIAAKFEEIDPPDVRDFVHMTQQACSRQAILSMEVKMLTALEFGLCRPTAVHFLDRYQRANRCNKTHRLLLEYVLQLALVDIEMTRYTPSQQVAAALLISARLTQQPFTLPPGLTRTDNSAHREERVTRCALDMCRLLQAAKDSPFQAVRKKFLRPEYHSVASLVSAQM
eukprot:gb/GFBE01080291.1/.p1 GENE.gb/GFBE01080291.1/~~gb/GFBE01080291.1/.p1  ORF type:complete len:393 (+),score=77.89 gb/GFBE01080291.1/:1-1179(+)